MNIEEDGQKPKPDCSLTYDENNEIPKTDVNIKSDNNTAAISYDCPDGTNNLF